MPSQKYRPLDALTESNAATLAATPKGNIQDSVEGHRPLDGVASVPPGTTAVGSDVPMSYVEDNLEHGVGRWEGIVDYYDEDTRARGKTHYTQPEADAKKKQDDDLIEMEEQQHNTHHQNHHMPGHDMIEGLKKRLPTHGKSN